MGNRKNPTRCDSDAFYTVEDLRHRLSISTAVFWRRRPLGRGALEELAAAGIKKIELVGSREQFDMTDIGSMRPIGEACRAAGIELVAYHACFTTFDGIESEAQRRELLDSCRRQIDTMLELGGTIWGSHMKIGGPDESGWKKSYLELARHVEGTDACIVIENGGIEHVLQGLDQIGHPKVGMLLDICHEFSGNAENVMCKPGEPTRLINRCRRHLRHIHMHGYVGGVGHQAPLADGDGIQWGELFEALYETGYSGPMNFEPYASPEAVVAVGRVPERIVKMVGEKR